MKEATGELNMTVVTIVAIAAVALLFYVFLWPTIQKSIVNQTCKTYGSDYYAFKATTGDADSGIADGSDTGAKVYKWKCCPSKDKGANIDESNSANCKNADI